MLGSSLLVDGALSSAVHSPWKKWTDYIMKQRKQLGFQKAALVRFDGSHVASTAAHLATESEIKVPIITLFNTQYK